MKTFAIATNDVRIQKGCMAILMKALDNNFTETPHSSQEVSFAGILNRRKGTALTPAPSFNKKDPTTNDADMTTELIGKTIVADTSPKAKQTNSLTIISPPKDHEETPSDNRKAPVSILIDGTSFPSYTDTVFTQTSNHAMPAQVIAPDLHEETSSSMPAITERGSHFVPAFPDGRISLPSSNNKWPEIFLQRATKPGNRVSSETIHREDFAPAANNILNIETAFPLKAPGSDQMIKTHFTPTSAKTEKADAASMNSITFQKDGSATPGKGADSEQTVEALLTLVPVKTEKAETAIMNQATGHLGKPVTHGNDAGSERTTEAGLETESADEGRIARHHFTKDVRYHIESKFMEHVANLLPQKEGSPAAENIFSHIRRSVVTTKNDSPSALAPKDAEPFAAMRNSAAIVNSERDLASKPVFLDQAESSEELTDRAVTMIEGATAAGHNANIDKNKPLIVARAENLKEGATAAGHDANIDKNKPLIVARAENSTERESFSFRVESLSTAPLSEAKAPLFDNQTVSRTQSIINQIIDAKQAMNGDFGRIRIVLSPPNLGTVDLKIVVRNERVEVVMTADNSSVQQALQSRTDDICNALQRHDLKIESFQVLLQDQNQNASQNNNHGSTLFEQHRENQATQDFKNSNAIPSPAPSPAVSSIPGSGLEKGRVSIFI
ncbi:MAG: flagellar hook-length control protein FliK [Pseudomonadota bacterium]